MHRHAPQGLSLTDQRFERHVIFRVALWRPFAPALSASLIFEKNVLLTVAECARCNIFFLKHPARGAVLTKQLLPMLQIQCSLLCNRTVQKSNARSRSVLRPYSAQGLIGLWVYQMFYVRSRFSCHACRCSKVLCGLTSVRYYH